MTRKKHGGIRFLTVLATLTILICNLITPLSTIKAYAAWNFPYVEINAEAGIVMDADTGAVLFQKNAHTKEYPASITKVLTALVVLDNCKLDDMVTFSHDDVYNVDAGSSNAQIEEGDTLSVEDCLHALLLKSANEAANALACHVAGSREAFAEMMNQKAAKLGCTDSHFTNPSGLFNENHYTSAYDMGLIGIAAMKNEAFMEIDSHLSYKLASTIRNPDGHTVYMEHKMHRDDTKYSDNRVIAGKTGYTMDSGNTLITMASENDRNLVAVVLKDKNPAHYTDTKAMLDLGFYSTENQLLDPSLFNKEDIKNRLIADTIADSGCTASDLSVKETMYVSLPVGSSQEGLTYRLNYNLPDYVSAHTIAEIEYLADGLPVGRYFIEKEPTVAVETTQETTNADEHPTEALTNISVTAIAGIIGVAILATFAALGIKRVRDSRKMARYMHDRRTERLKDLDMSEEEFMEVLQIRRSQKNQNHNNNNFNSNYNNNRYDHLDHNSSANRKNISRGRKDHRM